MTLLVLLYDRCLTLCTSFRLYFQDSKANAVLVIFGSIPDAVAGRCVLGQDT